MTKWLLAVLFTVVLLSPSITFATAARPAAPSKIQQLPDAETSSSSIPFAVTTHVYLGGKRIEAIINGAKYYYHTDYLGSTRIVTDSNGAQVARINYEPFGKELFDSSQKYKFTGKEEDISTGLSYFGARYYDPDIGRFTQNDPKPNPTESLYVYADNNPLKYVDPDGKESQSPKTSSRRMH